MPRYIDIDDDRNCYIGNDGEYERYNIDPDVLDEAVEVIRCKDCKHFEYDHPYVVYGVPVLGHLICNKWGDGCRTDENGFCFMAERREDA